MADSQNSMTFGQFFMFHDISMAIFIFQVFQSLLGTLKEGVGVVYNIVDLGVAGGLTALRAMVSHLRICVADDCFDLLPFVTN